MSSAAPEPRGAVATPATADVAVAVLTYNNVETVKTNETKAPEKAAEKPAEATKAVTEAPAIEAPAKKDASRLPGLEKPKPELKREGQVAVFISRKDGKLYVRQNFKPAFDVPVTIAAASLTR